MSLSTRERKQTAILWTRTARDRYGKWTYASPVAISVRWEDVGEEFVDDKLERRLSSAKVFLGQDVITGDVLMLGVIGDVDGDIAPLEHAGAFEIQKFSKNPSMNATDFLRTAWL